MAQYLSQEWHDQAKALAQTFPEKAGASVRMAVKVTGGPNGDVAYYQIIENGKVVEQSLGELSDSDVTMTSTWEDSVKVQKGELDANAAFMQGKMKVVGNIGKMMSLMPLTASPEYKAIQEQLRELTEY